MFPNIVAMFNFDYENEYARYAQERKDIPSSDAEASTSSRSFADAERLYYLFTDSNCPISFLDNKQAYDFAAWLVSQGVAIANSPTRSREGVI